MLKYRQRKVDLNAGEKSLVFVTKLHRKFDLHVQLSYTEISYFIPNLRKNAHLRKDAASLYFRLKKSSENMIFPWNRSIWKLMKIWSFLSFWQIFVRRKFLFSCSDSGTTSEKQKTWHYSLPYIGHLFHVTKKKLRHICERFCKDVDINMALSSLKLVFSVVRTPWLNIFSPMSFISLLAQDEKPVILVRLRAIWILGLRSF